MIEGDVIFEAAHHAQHFIRRADAALTHREHELTNVLRHLSAAAAMRISAATVEAATSVVAATAALQARICLQR